jgi:hypothetical protein
VTNKDETTWRIRETQAIKIAGTHSELKKLRGRVLLKNNAHLVVQGKRYSVFGTEKQVADIRARLKQGETHLLMCQRRNEFEKDLTIGQAHHNRQAFAHVPIGTRQILPFHRPMRIF